MRRDEPERKREPPFSDEHVSALFSSYPAEIRERLLILRKMIFEVAEKHEEIGEIVETIKWNVPSYTTVNPKSGISIRLDPCLNDTGRIGVYGHCQSSFIRQCKDVFGNSFEYDGQRGILLNRNVPLPEEKLHHVIYLALTYHRRK